MMFYEDESRQLEEAQIIDPICNGGNDVIALGPGDDLVSLLVSLLLMWLKCIT